MWSWWILWAALALAVFCPVLATVRATRSGLALLRELRATRGRIFDELDRLADAADAAATHAERAAGGSQRLTRSVARLTRSRRRLAVLRSAWDEVTDSVGAVTSLYPRK